MLGMTILISHPESPSIPDQIELYKSVGFDSVFIGSDTVQDLDELPILADTARQCGIVLEAFHAPSGCLNDLWAVDDGKAKVSLRTLFDAIDACGAAKIGKLVMHTAGSPQVKISECALSRFSALEEYAGGKGVVICYENANGMASLAAVMDNAKKPHGFCFDAGHQLCYSPDEPLLKQYGNRMLYTHLHDNDGMADRHWLPFDGARDWGTLAKTFAKIGYDGTLNLELACHSAPAYRALPFAAFVREAHARLVRFADLMERP